MSDLLDEVAARGKARYVQELFRRTARTYDRSSALLSLGLLPLWRRALVRRVPLAAGGRLLDVATGTGAVPCAAAARSGGRVRTVGIDFCRPMLEVARQRAARLPAAHRPRLVEGDALRLPFRDGAFDAVTLAFALRNFTDPGQGLAELVRVTRPGGTVATLDIARPTAWWVRLPHRFLFGVVSPLLDRLSRRRDGGGGRIDRFRYIGESHRYVPDGEELARRLTALGLERVELRRLLGGVVVILSGVRGAAPAP
jgi:demethylmenaquinone methyltransferase/2-methoxy-6-polyprenyl-1,4-benzoquinol methylase